MILKCICKNDFQDKTYGKDNRVHNPIKDPNKFRCTVCKNEKDGKK
jgi:hypothetical protein